ncbi:Transcription initiation factor TFIID subunit 9, partial [Ascosphaera acerosa]
MHMLLASQGVAAYQERVPLQLLDFAYRYTVNTLQDAVYLVTEGYPGGGTEAAGGAPTTTGGSKTAHHHHPPHDLSTISLAALRMSIASRLHYQFQPTLPKDFLLEMAAERNRVVLPGAVRGLDAGAAPASNSVLMGGIRLPPEQFCQTGVAWDLKEEWE